MLEMADTSSSHKRLEVEKINWRRDKSSRYPQTNAHLRWVRNRSEIKVPTAALKEAIYLVRRSRSLCREDEVALCIFW